MNTTLTQSAMLIGLQMNSTSTQSTMPDGPHRNLLTEKLAVDCEMMPSNTGQVLGRVSVVNYEGETVYDTFVCYPEPIIIKDTCEEHSGIGWSDIDPQNGAQAFSEVQTQLVELFCGRIVIGHDLDKDLHEISMDLPSSISQLQRKLELMLQHKLKPVLLWPTPFSMATRDTQKYAGYQRYAGRAHQGPNLNYLAMKVLRRGTKQGRVSSVKDAVATMEVYRHAEVEIDEEQGKK